MCTYAYWHRISTHTSTASGSLRSTKRDSVRMEMKWARFSVGSRFKSSVTSSVPLPLLESESAQKKQIIKGCAKPKARADHHHSHNSWQPDHRHSHNGWPPDHHHSHNSWQPDHHHSHNGWPPLFSWLFAVYGLTGAQVLHAFCWLKTCTMIEYYFLVLLL